MSERARCGSARSVCLDFPMKKKKMHTIASSEQIRRYFRNSNDAASITAALQHVKQCRSKFLQHALFLLFFFFRFKLCFSSVAIIHNSYSNLEMMGMMNERLDFHSLCTTFFSSIYFVAVVVIVSNLKMRIANGLRPNAVCKPYTHISSVDASHILEKKKKKK